MHAHVRASDPGAFGVGAVFVFERTLNQENLLAAEMGVLGEIGAGLPTDEGCAFGVELVQWKDAEAADHALGEGCSGGVRFNHLVVAVLELPQLHQDRAAVFCIRRLRCADGIAQVRVRAEVSCLIRERTFED